MANKGKCYYCGNEYQRRGMTRHLKACKARKEALEGETVTESVALHGYYTIKVQDHWNDRFWMYVMVREDATFKLLDDFFRGIWLECCNHLSEFTVGYDTFISDKGAGGFVDTFDEYGMDVRLQGLLGEGDHFKYVYDFGESSHLDLNVMDYHGGLPMDGAIYIAARNLPVFEDSPNSPRVGICGYDGDHGFDYKTLKVENYEVSEFESVDYGYDGYDDDDDLGSMVDCIMGSLDDTQIGRLKDMDDDDFVDILESLDIMEEFMGFIGNKVYQMNMPIVSTKMADLLKRFDKGGLMGFVNHYGLEIADGLDDEDIIKIMADSLPSMALESIKHLTTLQLKGLKKLYESSGVKLFTDVFGREFSTHVAVTSIFNMLLFTGIDTVDYEEEFVCVIPDEFKEQLKDSNWKEIMKLGQKNGLWVSLINGMLYYYGVMDIDYAVTEIKRVTGQIVDRDELVKVLESDIVWKGSFEITESHIAHWDVDDLEALLVDIDSFRKKNNGIEPRRLSKLELLKAEDEEYQEKTKAFQSLKKYVMSCFEVSSIEAEEDILDFLDDLDMEGYRIGIDSAIRSYMQCYGVRNLDHANEMSSYVTKVYNSHRQWRLLGHSPNSVEKMKAFDRNGEAKDNGNVYNMNTKKKVGRNDPCPCGSGKKYKKCCGR